MNEQLWSEVEAFDLSDDSHEYGFATRLAKENAWTAWFTKQAITEYKKFMYLAATGNQMVSPSEIVDTVWHLHLIYTKSYKEFCNLLGKQIQHIPSTHSREDYQELRAATKRTKELYEANFGEQPALYWQKHSIYDGLQLTPTNRDVTDYTAFFILGLLALTLPAFYLLRPVYKKIDNPYFIMGLLALAAISLLVLELINQRTFKNILSRFSKNTFPFHLSPLELVYLKEQKLSKVINGVVNELIKKGAITVNSDYSLQYQKNMYDFQDKEEEVVHSTLKDYNSSFYPILLANLEGKPIFSKVKISMDGFKKYILKTREFHALFFTNLAVCALLFLLSVSRLTIGISRSKPTTYITVVTLILTTGLVVFLTRLTNQFFKEVIPSYYKKEGIVKDVDDDWKWQYFLLGGAALATSFTPLAKHVNKSNYNSTCGTSCSSCSSGDGCSSCSSCGGCGGD